MAPTNFDIDEEACTKVMRRYCLKTKHDAVNFALRTMAAEPLSLDEAHSLPGCGSEGVLEDMRTGRKT
ncbi:MAG: type II toxin-antitoxin system VapB family antitoxin [Paracoccaceae bacterium]|nr:type II toxin-antitoxin system VapB family antitoxin [Paracoccaceae bacterium]